MSGLWLISYVVLWILVIVLSIIVLGLVRQLGLIHYRLESEQNLWTTPEGLEIGSKAPEFRAMDLIQGKELTLQNLKGSTSLLVFVSPTCGPCIELMPYIVEFQKSQDDKLNMMLVSQASSQASLDFVTTYKSRVFIIADPDSLISKIYKVPATPFAYHLDKDGIVRHRGITNNSKALDELIFAEVYSAESAGGSSKLPVVSSHVQ